VGMLADVAGDGAAHGLPQAALAARAVFDRANAVLGFDLGEVCFSGPQERLNATDVAQPALFAASVAMWNAMQAAGLADRYRPDAAAGLSLGEYTALWLAECFSFEDGLRIVRARGELMQAAAAAAPSGMVSIMGLDERAVQDLCDRSRQPGEVLSAANFNCPGQIVVSGSAAACERVVRLAEQAGGKAVALKVAGAFHSELMRPAAERLAGVLAGVTMRSPRIAVLSNVTGDYHEGDPDRIRQLLVEQVTRPVRWEQGVRRMLADGCGRFVEVGPGRVLTGLLRKIDRGAEAVNVSDASGLKRAGEAQAGQSARSARR
jgi:[acyl-carrier-protein] S-malonyltransferase